MKLSALIAVCLFTLAASAQDKWTLPKGSVPGMPVYQLPKSLRHDTMPDLPLYKTPGTQFPLYHSSPWLDSLKNGRLFLSHGIKPGVYMLPQDNMPCIVPNMTGATPIPNGMSFSLPFRTVIPNAIPR